MQDKVFSKHPELERLATPDGQLDDNIINRYGQLLVEKSRHRIFLFDSIRWVLEVENHSQVHQPNRWNGLREWFQQQKEVYKKKRKLRERLENMQMARYLFFPINDHGNHWILGVLDNQNRQICIYDSLNATIHDQTLKRLKIFAKAFIAADVEWVCMLCPVHPQGATLNCGVFVCAYMRTLAHAFHQQMDFTAADILHLRALIGWEIVKGNVNTVGLY